MIVEADHIRDNGIVQDSDSDACDCSRSNIFEDILKDISSYTSCLMDLVPSMNEPLAMCYRNLNEAASPHSIFSGLQACSHICAKKS